MDGVSNNTTPIDQTEEPIVTGGTTPNPEDKVAYSSYVKALEEKKRVQKQAEELRTKLAQYEMELKTAEEEKLRKNGEDKKLLEIRDRELAEARAIIANVKAEAQNRLKKKAFQKACGDTPVIEKYENTIPIEDIPFDETTGEVDQVALIKVAQSFIRDYPELLTRRAVGMPSSNPQRAVGGLTLAEWEKLPAKEMKARYKEIIDKP